MVEVSPVLLEEFDGNKNAKINPWDVVKHQEGFPKIAVSCFSKTMFERLLIELKGVLIATTHAVDMDIPIYKVVYNEVEIALFKSYVGSAACVAVLEDIYAMGAERVILFGTCGVLDSSIEDCSIIIPNAAVRDEGTSYHYAQTSDEIIVNEKYKKEFVDILKKYRCTYTEGKVWTTDAFYRETPDKIMKRKQSGCICVDMECSAVAALAKFRDKEVFHFFYAADNLDNEEWDPRSLACHDKALEKHRIALLAMDLAEKLA